MGLEVIGESAFFDCTSLDAIYLPPTLKKILQGAFAESSVRSIELPDSLETIGEGAFYGCYALQNFRIPPYTTKIVGGVFCACGCMISIEIPQGIQAINCYAFHLCHGLRNIAIPSSVNNIEKGILEECEDLQCLFPNQNGLLKALERRFDGLPIHRLCYYHSYHATAATLQSLKKGLESSTDVVKHQDCLGMTPLHILALSTKQRLELYQVLVRRYPHYLVTKDEWGDLPLHYACKVNAPLEIVQFLLEAHKQAFPNYKLDWKKAVEVSGTSIELLVPVANSIFGSRYCALGLQQWQLEITKMINSIPLDTWKRDNFIVQIQAKLLTYEMMEATSLVELALWKAKLDESAVPNQSDCEYIEDMSGDELTRRKNCRVSCGVESVIANVLPFLQSQRKFT